jgi:hypothetical protein
LIFLALSGVEGLIFGYIPKGASSNSFVVNLNGWRRQSGNKILEFWNFCPPSREQAFKIFFYRGKKEEKKKR